MFLCKDMGFAPKSGPIKTPIRLRLIAQDNLATSTQLFHWHIFQKINSTKEIFHTIIYDYPRITFMHNMLPIVH